MELIGFNGKKGSGKDTAGKYLVEQYGYERLSFATDLKRSAAAALGLPAEETTFEQWKNNPNARIILQVDGVEIVNISVREYLQFYGAEAHRDIFGADFWTRILIDNLEPHGRYVITDARFVNECTAVRAVTGTIVVIERDGTDSDDTHASEAALPDDLVNTTLYNNGTIIDLHGMLDAYMGLRA